MELSIMNVIIVMLVCAMSAFLSHMGMAVFHDGIYCFWIECRIYCIRRYW